MVEAVILLGGISDCDEESGEPARRLISKRKERGSSQHLEVREGHSYDKRKRHFFQILKKKPATSGPTNMWIRKTFSQGKHTFSYRLPAMKL